MKNILIYLLSNIANGLLPLALLPFYTQYLTPEEYGFVALFQMFFVFFRSMSGASYVTASERNYFGREYRNKVYVNSCFNLIVITCFILLLICSLFSDFIYNISDLSIVYIVKAVATGAFAVVVQLRLSQWQVEKKASMYGVLQVSLGMLNNFSGAFLVIYIGMGVEGRIDSIFYTYMLFSLICYCSLLKENKIKFKLGYKEEFKVYKDIFKFSLPLLPHILGVLLLTIFDRFILKVNLGLEIVGIYMVSFQLMSSIGMLSDAFNKFFSPVQMKLMSGGTYKECKSIVRYIYIWSIFIVISGFISTLVFNYFVHNFLDAEYLDVTNILPWMAAGQVFNGIYLSLLNVIYYSKKTTLLSISTIIVSAIHLIMFYFLTNLYGLEGAGMAFCSSMAIRLVFTFVLSNKVFKLPWLT